MLGKGFLPQRRRSPTLGHLSVSVLGNVPSPVACGFHSTRASSTGTFVEILNPFLPLYACSLSTVLRFPCTSFALHRGARRRGLAFDFCVSSLAAAWLKPSCSHGTPRHTLAVQSLVQMRP